eukprot:3454035-Rhodomonas_salina.6
MPARGCVMRGERGDEGGGGRGAGQALESLARLTAEQDAFDWIALQHDLEPPRPPGAPPSAEARRLSKALFLLSHQSLPPPPSLPPCPPSSGGSVVGECGGTVTGSGVGVQGRAGEVPFGEPRGVVPRGLLVRAAAAGLLPQLAPPPPHPRQAPLPQRRPPLRPPPLAGLLSPSAPAPARAEGHAKEGTEHRSRPR